MTFGTGTTTPADQQLSTAEILTEVSTTQAKTYGGATTVSGQASRTFHIVGFQDWDATGSVCKFLEDNAGKWVPFEYWQYGGGTTASVTQPKVTGNILCQAPKRGGTVDELEDFDLTLGVSAYTVATA